MDEDFQQENRHDSVELSNNSTKTLPPRCTLHDVKETETAGGSKIIQLLFGSFVFIVIIAIILLFVLKQEENTVDTLNGDQNTVQETEHNNNQTGDNTKGGVSDTNADNSGSDKTSENTDPTDTTDQTTNKPDDQTQNNTNPNSGNTSDTTIQNGESNSEQTTSTTNENQIYEIKKGDNLYRISIKFYKTGKYYEALAIYNNLTNVDAIYAGLKIKIPPKEKLK